MAPSVWQGSWKKRAEVAAIAGLATPLLRLLGATLALARGGRGTLAGGERAAGHGIHAFWHGRIVHGTLHFRDRGIVVITSENFDGEWIARIIHRFGFGTARGFDLARRAQGYAAARERREAAEPGLHGGRAGARCRVAQPGAVWLSKATGNPVIPFHVEAATYWSLELGPHADPEALHHHRPGVREPFTVPRDADDDSAGGISGGWSTNSEPPNGGAPSCSEPPGRAPDARQIRMQDHQIDHQITSPSLLISHLPPSSPITFPLPGHPERPERARPWRRWSSVSRAGGGRVIEPTATDEDLVRVHTAAAYVQARSPQPAAGR